MSNITNITIAPASQPEIAIITLNGVAGVATSERSLGSSAERNATAADPREAEREADSRVSAVREGKRSAPGQTRSEDEHRSRSRERAKLSRWIGSY